ncbi:hypothetical protein FACS189434_01610 [Bacteroidia bacterium]|nr:hypothetical protein FACS189434_01610 [Bacteroidia bacterium]
MKCNYFVKAIVAIALVLGISACNDDKTKIIDGNYTPNDEEAFALIDAAYRPYQTLSSTFTSLIDTPVDGFTSFLGKEEDDCTKAARINIEYDNLYPRKTFNALYESIAIVNDALDKINASDKLSESGKKTAIARAKFLRGLFYSYLVQLWGEVPISLDNGVGSKTERKSIDEVYTQIVKDLTEAEVDLPAYNASPIIPQKGAANTLLARVYLAWGNNPLNQEQVAAIASGIQDPAVSYNNERLEKAVLYADKVINSGNYDLLPDFRKNWGLANESKGKEQIFTIRHEGDAIDKQGNHQAHCASHSPYDEDQVVHIQPAHTYDWWSDDDPRKAFSVLDTIREKRAGKSDSIHTFRWPHQLNLNGKGVDHSYANSEYLTQTRNYVDRIEIRYAEVLITKAEALVQLGKDNATATELINKIRTRGFDGSTAHNYASVTLQNVQDEWEYEFQYEQHRWLNLTRWKNLITTVKTLVPTYTYFDDKFADPENVVTVNGIEHKVGATFARYHLHLKGKYENIKGRNYRFPIPQSASFQDLGIRPQNPGYSEPVANK